MALVTRPEARNLNQSQQDRAIWTFAELIDSLLLEFVLDSRPELNGEDNRGVSMETQQPTHKSGGDQAKDGTEVQWNPADLQNRAETRRCLNDSKQAVADSISYTWDGMSFLVSLHLISWCFKC